MRLCWRAFKAFDRDGDNRITYPDLLLGWPLENDLNRLHLQRPKPSLLHRRLSILYRAQNRNPYKNDDLVVSGSSRRMCENLRMSGVFSPCSIQPQEQCSTGERYPRFGVEKPHNAQTSHHLNFTTGASTTTNIHGSISHLELQYQIPPST